MSKILYQFAQVREGELCIVKFSCYEEAKKWIDGQIVEFKSANRVKDENMDESFKSFKKCLEDALDAQQCRDHEKCTLCKDEDHEGWACRCESRNIKVAKERREKGQSPWKKKNVLDSNLCSMIT